MALLSSVFASLWLILCCCQHVTGHDDAGVLVQRSVLQHGQAPFLLEKVPLCTRDEELKYMQDFQVFASALMDKRKGALENFTNMSRGVIATHAAPLLNVSDRILAAAVQALRPAVMKIMKYGMQQVMKPKTKYSTDFQVDINKTILELQTAAKPLPGIAKAIFFEGLAALDESLNHSPEAAPPGVPTVGPPTKEADVKNYMLKKVLPTIVAETNPALAKSAWMLSSGHDVDKVIFPLMEAVYSKMQEPLPENLPLPKRRCVMCVERYWYMVDNVENGCIAERCDSIIMECTDGPTVSCLRRFAPCFKCHSELMEQLDQCSNATELVKLSTKFNNISTILSTQLNEHYEKFIARVSEAIVY